MEVRPWWERKTWESSVQRWEIEDTKLGELSECVDRGRCTKDTLGSHYKFGALSRPLPPKKNPMREKKNPWSGENVKLEKPAGGGEGFAKEGEIASLWFLVKTEVGGNWGVRSE